MASIERTAYPRFRRLVRTRELAALTPTADEVAWARAHARSGEHLLALVLSLACFQRLGYFSRPGDVPVEVVEHIRRHLELPLETSPSCAVETAKSHRRLVRERLGVVHDPERARAVASAAVRSAAQVKNDPPDLINVALEMLVKESLELPAFSTLDEIASRIRREVNTGMFERIDGRIGLPDRVGLEALLQIAGAGVKTPFNRIKQAAGRGVMVGVSRAGRAAAMG
jgi:Domain of unknown function (DUF4158)